MKIKIQINCDDDLSAIKAFLSVVRTEISNVYKNKGGVSQEFGESNFLGSYEVIFENEKAK